MPTLLRTPKTFLPLMAFITLLIAACDTAQPEQNEVTQLKAPQALIQPLYEFGSEEPNPDLHEFTCMEKGFKDHIRKQPAPGSEIGLAPNLTVLASELQRVVGLSGSCVPAGLVKHGIIVHFGLTHDQFDVVLQAVCLKYDAVKREYEYAPSELCYTIGGDKKLYDNITTLSDWKASSLAAYEADVIIHRHTGSGWKTFETGRDVTQMVFPYEGELDLLIANNGLLPDGSVRLVPTAEPAHWTNWAGEGLKEYDYSQGVTWVPVGTSLTTVFNPAKPYEGKGADLGSPCPPNCPKVKFRVNGIPRRPGC